jgi:hypothetical protein
MILSRYRVKVFNPDNKVILEHSEWGKSKEDAEQKMVDYIQKSHMSVYINNAPLVIIAELES